MRKTLFALLFSFLFVCTLAGCTPVANENDEPEYLPLYDENDFYIEQNFIANCALEKKDGLALIKDNKTEYRVFCSQTEDKAVGTAIKELQNVFLACGCTLERTTSTDGEKLIIIGKTDRFTPEKPLQKTGAYVVATVGNNLFIYAETNFGVTNGIYGFMEDYLGCMFFDDVTTHVPALSSLILAPTCDVQEPAFERRDMGDKEVWHTDSFDEKLRVRADETFDPNGCHNSLNMISGDILAKHPEYYAEIGGQRRTGEYLFQPPQLCFSNPEVVDLLEQAVVEKAKKHTGAVEMWWDISQQDSMNYCHCARCTEMSENAGGNPAAPIYNCVNTIAKRHPDLKFSTLAYHYGSTPPENIEFESNVLIKWCIMSSFGRNDYSHPLSSGASTIALQQYDEICGWAELTDEIFVWDYITDFFYYYLPFPSLDAMADNIRLLRDCGVKGVLTLSCHNSRGSCDRLKANFAAHLLWNPDVNERQFIGKFLTLYFGKDVAVHINNVYRRMQETVSAPLCVYDFPVVHQKDYLSPDNIAYYFEELDAAFAACGNDETVQKRLRFERLSIVYAALETSYGTASETAALKEEFAALCKEFGVTFLNELGDYTVDEFLASR